MKPTLTVVQVIHEGISGADVISGDVKTFPYTRGGAYRALEFMGRRYKHNQRCYGSVGAGGIYIELRDDTGEYRFGRYTTEINTDLSAAEHIEIDAEIDAEWDAMQQRETLRQIAKWKAEHPEN